jgi:hypothetical protein
VPPQRAKCAHWRRVPTSSSKDALAFSPPDCGRAANPPADPMKIGLDSPELILKEQAFALAAACLSKDAACTAVGRGPNC